MCRNISVQEGQGTLFTRSLGRCLSVIPPPLIHCVLGDLVRWWGGLLPVSDTTARAR